MPRSGSARMNGSCSCPRCTIRHPSPPHSQASPCSLVDVSHRQTAIILEGPGAADTLNAAVPLELSDAAFPVGMCVRTIFEKAEIVLWRTGLERFHVEVWRSFGPYVWELLDLVRTENAAL